MQIALGATLLLLAVWLVALRPKSQSAGEAPAPAPAPVQSAPASDGGAAPGTAGLNSAIDKAHSGVATADADAQRAQQTSADGAAQAGATGAAAPAASARAHSGAATTRSHAGSPAATRHAKRGSGSSDDAHQHHAASSQLTVVKTALRHHKAVAVAFVDPQMADARAVAQEIRHVSTFHGRAVALAVPLTKLSDYAFITNRVEVTVAPTVVIIDRRGQATTIVGFTDRGEIEQRLADALAAKPKR
jgi:hypothetical protein